jgi:hypothetical protein
MLDDATVTPRYLGANSVLAFFDSQSSPEGRLQKKKQAVLEAEILPILGLQNPASLYPFMAANQIERLRLEVVEALPPNREILRCVLNGAYFKNELMRNQDLLYLPTDCSSLLAGLVRY